MSIHDHPRPGTILLCDFNAFKAPEMVGYRPVVVLSSKIRARPGLCTVVCLSMTDPCPQMPYHCQIDIRPELPRRWISDGVWVKGDMLYSVGFHRLNLIWTARDASGKRIYRMDTLTEEQMRKIRCCVLNGLGLIDLTKRL